MISNAASAGGTWWVIEKNPKTLLPEEMPHYVPADRSPEVIGQADILVITGVTLINHTLEGILSAARPDADIAVMGPTAGGLPDPLFKRGVPGGGGCGSDPPGQAAGNSLSGRFRIPFSGPVC